MQKQSCLCSVSTWGYMMQSHNLVYISHLICTSGKAVCINPDADFVMAVIPGSVQLMMGDIVCCLFLNIFIITYLYSTLIHIYILKKR